MTRRPSGKRLFKVALVADTHVNEKEDRSSSPYPANAKANPRTRHVFTWIGQKDAAFVVHLGDIVHPVPELKAYVPAAENFKALAACLPMPLYLVPGNHDIGDKPVDWMPAGTVCDKFIALYEQHFGRHHFSFDYDDIHFVIINTSLINSGVSAEQTQKQWLESDLSANVARRTFLFMHYPLFISNRDEPGSYDNIDEPGRSWLISLIEKHHPEALFCGHSHNFWYDVIGETEVYVLTSTSFVRHDYSEMYRIDAGDQFGRNDTAKLGHVTLEIFERGHVAHFHRTYGATHPEFGAGVIEEPWYSDVHVKTCTFNKVSVDMRHAWAEELAISPSGALDEFQRKYSRNDYPLMALWEMGLSGMRVPAQDLMDPATRRRMEILKEIGHRFHVYQYDVPDKNVSAAIRTHARLIDRLEIVIGWDRRDKALPAISALKDETGVSIILSRVNRNDAAKKLGGLYNHLISHGFSALELGELAELACRSDAQAIDGFMFSILREVDPGSIIETLDQFAAEVHKLPVLYVKSTMPSPWDSFQDDTANGLRIARAVLAAAASRFTEIVLDTFADADRGYFVRNGLVDRRYNPRSTGRLMTALMGALSGSTWGPGEAHGAVYREDGRGVFAGLVGDTMIKSFVSQALSENKQGSWRTVGNGLSGQLASISQAEAGELVVIQVG